MNNSFSIDSRVPSIMIAGPSNFPVRKKEKQNAARHSNMEEWRDIQGLLDKIRSTGMGGISADDPNAISKLETKLAGLEKSQETMKAANAYYRKNKTLDGCPVLSAEQIQKLTADMANRWYGRVATQPFEAYSLQNNNAEIRRVKGRIEELTRYSNTAFAGWQFDGGKVEANTQDNRLQVFFNDKPDADTRTELKSNGFHWSPKATPEAGAWQRQLNLNAYRAAGYVKPIQPLTGEHPIDLQRKAMQKAAQPAPEQQPDAPGQADTYLIYQLKRDDSTRDFRYEPLERLQAAGLAVDPANYELVYTAPITADTGSLGQIYEKFNIDRPEDFKGHSLSISDIVIIKQEGEETAHYVDRYGFKEVPQFLQPTPERPTFDMQHTAEYLQQLHDNVMNADPNKTMGVAAYNTAIKRLEKLSGEIPGDHPQLIALVNHAAESTDLTMLKQRMATVHNEFIQPINYLETAEKSTEQNYNMIDGIMNNTPTVDELEARVKAGERINLLDLANAVKAEKPAPTRDTGKKPSIRKELAEGKARLAKDKPAPDRAKAKNVDLEV